MKKKQIKSLAELKRLASQKNGFECFVLLNGGLRSRKYIRWYPKAKIFSILNYIDDTKQRLTEKQIMNKNYTNIGEAIKKGALIY